MFYTTKQFAYERPTNTFVAEASDLQMRNWPETFMLRSHKTGKIVKVRKDYEAHDERENELLSVHYRPEGPGHDWKVVVIND